MKSGGALSPARHGCRARARRMDAASGREEPKNVGKRGKNRRPHEARGEPRPKRAGRRARRRRARARGEKGEGERQERATQYKAGPRSELDWARQAAGKRGPAQAARACARADRLGRADEGRNTASALKERGARHGCRAPKAPRAGLRSPDQGRRAKGALCKAKRPGSGKEGAARRSGSRLAPRKAPAALPGRCTLCAWMRTARLAGLLGAPSGPDAAKRRPGRTCPGGPRGVAAPARPSPEAARSSPGAERTSAACGVTTI